MTFITSATGRACLNDWHKRIEACDLLLLLADLKRTVAGKGRPAILIVVVRKTVPMPANSILSSLHATLPPILDWCQELAVAVEGGDAERNPLRSCFRNTRWTASLRNRALVFDSLSAAFAYAQRFAPHDVLELQRHVLHQHFAPNGH